MWRKSPLSMLFGAVFAACAGNLAYAQDSISNAIGKAPTQGNEQLPPNLQPSIASSIPALAQFKKGLLDLGYNFQLNYTGEVLGNPVGGVKQRAIYEDLLELALDGDLDKITGLSGASFHINTYLVNGPGLSTCCVFNFLTISSIEAQPSTRLFEAWFEQKLFGDMASIRIGQLAADTEFFISDFAAGYVNATFGWPNILAADLPSTGPNYPLATPGVRLRVTPNDQTTLLVALLNGDPSGAGFTGLPEILDPAGINFRLRDPPLVIAEAQYRYNQDKDASGLAGTAKIGAWYHFGNFGGPRIGFPGISFPDHHGDYGIYGIIDQMVWRLPGDDPKKGVGVFALVSASPSDRNVADFYTHAGVNFMGLWDKRPEDMFGMAVAYSPVSPSLIGLDSDTSIFAKTALLIRDYEMALELTYQASIIPGWIIQPDFQYIFHPGYGTIDPVNPAVGRIPDAAVLVLRTTIKF
jgi:porin